MHVSRKRVKHRKKISSPKGNDISPESHQVKYKNILNRSSFQVKGHFFRSKENISSLKVHKNKTLQALNRVMSLLPATWFVGTER